MMNPFELLPDIDPFVNVQSDRSLPPDIDCANLSQVFALMEPRVGAALLDKAGRAALRHIANRISTHLSSFWGLEIWLGDAAPRADFLWEVAQKSDTMPMMANGGILTLAGRDFLDPAPEATSALRKRSPFWRDLGRFAEEWLDNPDWLRRLGNIWLEADAASTAALSGAELDVLLDRPNLFWGPGISRAAGADRDLLGHLAALSRRFYGLELDQARINAAADALPEEGKVFQMGVMGAREDHPGARLCVQGLDTTTDKERWLAAIGWPGDRARLRDTLAWLEPLCGEISLNVDIMPDRVGPRLGLEIYSARPVLSMDAWRPLHEKLSAQGLARAEKLAALEDFPSFQRFRQYDAWRRTPPFGCPVLASNLHHLKLVFAEDAVIEAKAYLSIFRPVFDYTLFANRLRGGGQG